MKKLIRISAIGLFVCFSTFDAGADTAPAPPSSGMSPWSKLSLQGDHIRLLANSLPAYKIGDNGKPIADNIVTLLKGSCFRVNQELDFSAVTPDVQGVLGTLGDTDRPSPIYITLESQKGESFSSTPKMMATWECEPKTDDQPVTVKNDANAKVGDTYLTSREVLEKRDHLRYGFTYGVLITPFKYYFAGGNGKNHVASQTTIGGYLGYRFYDRPGTSNVFAISAGPVSATGNNLSNGGTVDVNGASLAFAYLVEIKGRFIGGVILGKDFYEKPAGVDVPINAKLWLGVNLGLAIN